MTLGGRVGEYPRRVWMKGSTQVPRLPRVDPRVLGGGVGTFRTPKRLLTSSPSFSEGDHT